MSSKRKSKEQFSSRLLALAIVLLCNPLINVVDYFPDFIGCFIIASAISHFADKAPYFEEARACFIKLALINLAKIPSFIIIVRIISNNVGESDIRILFTFVFAAIEIVVGINAITNLFSALSYLGQRSDAVSLITPFEISKSRRLSTEKLQMLCYAFVICRSTLSVLPELLRLTSTDAILNPNHFNPARLFPYAITLSFITVFVFGIILAKRAKKFIKAIYKEDKIFSAADSMIDEAGRENIKKKRKIRKMQLFLTTIATSSLLLFNLPLAKFGYVNVIPDFVFGIVIIVAVLRSTKFIKNAMRVVAGAVVFTAASTAKYIMEIIFLDTFTYEQLSLSAAASSKYLPVILLSALETLLFAVLIILLGTELIKFTKKRTGTSQKSEKYTSFDEEYHRNMKKKCIGWTALAVLIHAIKLAEVIAKASSQNIGSLSLVFCLAFVIYSYYLFGQIKEEVKNKYL